MIAYRATLNVPRELAQFTAKLLLAERRRRGTPRGSRALTCFWQAVLGLLVVPRPGHSRGTSPAVFCGATTGSSTLLPT